MSDAELSEFQTRLREELEAGLGARKLDYSVDPITSSDDVHLVVRSAGVEAFIYRNDAGWRLGMRWQPFELADFGSADELISKFVTEVVEIARTGFPPQQTAGSTALYFRGR